MENLSEYSALMTNREHLYRFLARIYKIETDQVFLEQLKSMAFPADCGEEELNAGYRTMEEYLRQFNAGSLTDLAVDYARVFLGAGIVGNDAAYPYESVYTSPKRLIMQEARDEVLAAYRQKGLSTADLADTPEDHIAFEFEFMAYLCHEAKEVLADGDRAKLSACLKEQMDFLAKHLLNWVPEFCADIDKFAATEFYKGAAKITNGYLHLDKSMLEDMLLEAAECSPK